MHCTLTFVHCKLTFVHCKLTSDTGQVHRLLLGPPGSAVVLSLARAPGGGGEVSDAAAFSVRPARDGSSICVVGTMRDVPTSEPDLD